MIKSSNDLIALLVNYQYFLFLLSTNIDAMDAFLQIDQLLLILLSGKSYTYFCFVKHFILLFLGLLVESKIILYYVLNYYGFIVKFLYSMLFIISSSLKILYFSKATKVKMSYSQLIKHVPMAIISKIFNLEFIYLKKYGRNQWIFPIMIIYNLLLLGLALY